MGYGSSGEESNEGNSAAPMDSEVTTVAAPHSNDASGSSQAPAATMEAPMAMDNVENLNSHSPFFFTLPTTSSSSSTQDEREDDDDEEFPLGGISNERRLQRQRALDEGERRMWMMRAREEQSGFGVAPTASSLPALTSASGSFLSLSASSLSDNHDNSDLTQQAIDYRTADGTLVCARSHVYMSADLSHSNAFVQHVMDGLISDYAKEFQSSGRELEHVVIWSDGCASQFKNKKQVRC